MYGEKEELGPRRSLNDNHNIDSKIYESRFQVDAFETIVMVEATEDNFIDDPRKFQLLLEDAENPLYKGCLTLHKVVCNG